eukprot:358823-Chlamydomonas_euryale.AAC.4
MCDMWSPFSFHHTNVEGRFKQHCCGVPRGFSSERAAQSLFRPLPSFPFCTWRSLRWEAGLSRVVPSHTHTERGFVVQSNVPSRAPAERDLSYQLCVDDQALLCPSLPALQAAAGVLQDTARERGFTINFAKTKGMLMQPPTAPPVEAPATFQLPGGHSVEVVSTFKYVGL